MKTTLIEQMKLPGFYPHRVQEPIQLIQTHISYVFLTGDYAYKLKKPVNFGFLDFSTLAKRKHFLHEEIKLNKILAPEIYLQVLPITEAERQVLQVGEPRTASYIYSIAGTGEIVEYVLKMRQFAQENIFSNMFESGLLTEEHIRELALLVAQFHAKTITNEHISSFGTIEKILEGIEENYQNTKKYIGIVQSKKRYEATKKFTDEFLVTNEDIFKNRQKQQKIRECHGDLHLNNICLWNNQIQLFDRIEFNEPFKNVDVIYDIAFTIMDLDTRGRKDLSNVFLNTYLEATGDWEGVQVLPLYLTRQAYVRAKVSSFVLDDPNISLKAKQQAALSAEQYYQQASEYTLTSTGHLMIMSGLSGSGKSTVARYIATRINAIIIRSDALRKHLAGIPLTEKGSPEIYTASMTQKTYNRLLELGITLAKQGFKVILDAKFDQLRWREKATRAATIEQIPFNIIHCRAPKSILTERLSSRIKDVSDATPVVLAQQFEEPFTEDETSYLLTIDTTQADWQAIVNLELLGNCSLEKLT